VLGAHGQLRDFAGLRGKAAEHFGHASGVKQLLWLAFILVGVFGVGGVEQGNGVVEAFLMGNHRRSRVHGLPN
jgi:hypothetical protein